MKKTLTKGCIVGGIILYVWMMISWMVLPWHCWAFKSLRNEEPISQVIRENTLENGVYILPNFCNTTPENKAQKEAQMARGPFVFMSVLRDGYTTNVAKPMILSFITQLIGALLVTYLLLQTKGLSYMGKVGFVTLIGFLIGFLGHLPNWTWWGFSPGFTLVEILDSVIAWFLAGLAIANIVQKSPKSA